jgi:plastocyanin
LLTSVKVLNFTLLMTYISQLHCPSLHTICLNRLSEGDITMRKILLVIISVFMLGAGGMYFDVNNSLLASPHAAAQQQASSVTIHNFAFSPASVTVAPGTTVTWTNNDSTAHTVTADSGNGPKSGQLQQGQTYSFTFSQAGTYAYHCSIHPEMKATVTVSSSSTTTPPASGQQPKPSAPSSGGMGAGTAAPQPAAPSEEETPSGGLGGQVATGPVETGAGTVVANRHQNETIAIVIGSLALVVATGLLISRRLLLSRSR